ncbi:hypothetical protein D3C83_80240 [compost metagenome]
MIDDSICAATFLGCSATPVSTADHTSCTRTLPVFRSSDTSATCAQCVSQESE